MTHRRPRARRKKGSSRPSGSSRRTTAPVSRSPSSGKSWVPPVLIAILVLVAAGMAVLLLRSANQNDSGALQIDEGDVAAGKILFRANCAQCHGTDLGGTTSGPPLLIATYAPNHHGDEAIQSAVANGVPPHHWNLGPMPAIDNLGRDEVARIAAYIRSEQVGAGIVNDPSHR